MIAAVPAAELGRTLVARTVSGKVYVRRPATASLLDLGTVAGIPVGTEIDARKGRVRLTAAATRGKAAHRAEFFGGMFVVTQAADDIVDLRLSEPFGSCAKKTGTRLRKLWGDGTGRFRMRGLNAVVTVRGTRWLVQDSCDGHAHPRLPGPRLGPRHRQAQDLPRARRPQVPGRAQEAQVAARTT